MRLVITALISLLLTFNSFAYTYEEFVDLSTGTTTFYLVFEDHDSYRPFGQKLEALEITEGPGEIQIPEVINKESVVEATPVYGDIHLSEEDAYALRWVLCLEEEGFEEECRVCEAIFNRVLSERDWGNSVLEVLKKKGQFPTYKYIDSKKAWDTPGEIEDDVISEVLRETSTRLPSTRYVYFDSKGGVNGKDHVRYGGTTYGRE